MRNLFTACLIAFLAGCANLQYSEDPRIAEIQKWAQACGQMGQAIQTALFLGEAEQLTENEAKGIDKLDRVFRPVCTGDPGPLKELFQDSAVRVAVADYCPGLIVGDNLTVTATQLATCIARDELVKQFQIEVE